MITRRPLLLGIVGAGLLSSRARAQDGRAQTTLVEPPAALLRAYERLRSAGVPALAVAAANRDGLRMAFAEGVRAIGQSARVTTSDKWHLGSIAKSMTATLVARLVEHGAISWDDTIGTVLGATIPDMRDEYRDVNLRHLLSHRGGLRPNIDEAVVEAFPRESADPRADRVAYSRLGLLQEPAGPKERRAIYSNTGYVVVGAMLEAKLGAPWETLVHDHVFAPLGMTSAGQGAPGTPGLYDQPVGHAVGASGALESSPPGSAVVDNVAALGPAGRVHASLDDVLKHLNAHSSRDASFLRPESWDMLHTPPFGGAYAMGWWRGGQKFQHSGSNGRWYAEVLFDRSSGAMAVAAMNDGRRNVRNRFGAVIRSAADAVG